MAPELKPGQVPDPDPGLDAQPARTETVGLGFASPAADTAASTATASTGPATFSAASVSSGSLLDRLVPPMPRGGWIGWAGPLLVTLLGGFLRFFRLGVPHGIVFDETYYVPDAYSILRHGVELYPNGINVKTGSRAALEAMLVHGHPNFLSGNAEYVVHPPLGKVMIAIGEAIFGLNPFGWRFACAVAGTAAILMTARIARRMTRSTLLGCVAGLLMALDGLELVLSRTAILDIFVMFWVLAAFGMIVLERDAARAKLARLVESGQVSVVGGGPNLGIRWRLLLAGAFLGLACGTKWNGIWYVIVFAALVIAWDLGARRAAGFTDRLAGTARSGAVWLPVSFGVVPFVTYLATWIGWFATSAGYDRNWASLNGNHIPIWSAIDSFYQDQKSMLATSLGINSPHAYGSPPWTWFILGRPVSMFYAAPNGPGCKACMSQEVLAIGTPAIWWISIVALLFCLVWWIARRDWRAGAILISVAAGWLPWFWYSWHDHRTEFYFYAIVFLPFMVLAITLCLGLITGPVRATVARRAAGAAITGAYLLVVLANFVWMYPVLTAEILPYAFWHQRMWFSAWI